MSALDAPREMSGSQALWLRAIALQRTYPILQLVALVVTFIYGAQTLPGLATWPAMKSILVLASLAGLASVGQTMLILMGGFDLGISGIMVASALTVTSLASKYHLSFAEAFVIAIVAAGLLGAMAGQVCHRFHIQPLIVTLATGTIAVGIVQVQTGGLQSGDAPQWLIDLTSPGGKSFGLDIPPLIIIWAVVAVVMTLFLHRTVAGRRVMATGANPSAAEYSLISTRLVWTLAFAFSAIIAALVGILVGGFAGSIESTVADPYLFQSVVAVIVGGTVFGGPGDYARTCVGALFLTLLTTVLIGHGADQADQNILYGLAILIAVSLYGRERQLRDRI
jgi:ribose transport system permease protein